MGIIMINKLRLKYMEIAELITKCERESKNNVKWKLILDSFGFDYLLNNHKNLFNQQIFLDSNYENILFNIIYESFQNNPENASEMIKYLFNKYGLSIEGFDDILFEKNEDNIRPSTSPTTLYESVFISYSSEDKEKCKEIKESLEEIGLKSFLAHEDIEISDEWAKAIMEELGKVDILIALLSENFKKSEYCSQEVGIALYRNVKVIPASIDETESFGFLSKNQAKKLDKFRIQKKIVNEFSEVMIDKLINNLGGHDFDYNATQLKLLEPYFNELTKDQINYIVDICVKDSQIFKCNRCIIVLQDAYADFKHKISEDLINAFEEKIINISADRSYWQ